MICKRHSYTGGYPCPSCSRIEPAEVAQGEAVAAQARFRHPQKGTPDWSPWQPAAIRCSHQTYYIDTQGWETEYRLLYAAPQSQSPSPSPDAEMAALLLRVQVSLSLDDTEWGYSGTEKCTLLADIRAKLASI
jgi:hypothetical protein